jgi:hypothetical protein
MNLFGIILSGLAGRLGLTREELLALESSPGCGGCLFLSLIFLFLAMYVGDSLTHRLFELYQSYIVGGF